MAENNEQPRKKLSRGRQKVAMVKMSNESNLQVTFSKRRTGLFKKASELCTLCGAEMALVVFSPGKKVFSFGHPSVDTVLDRYAGIAGDASAAGPTSQLIEAHRSVSLRDLNTQLSHMLGQVEGERKRGEQMSRERREAIEAQRWWEAPAEKIEETGKLQQLGQALGELKRAVSAQSDRIVIETTAAANAVAVAAMANHTARASSGGGHLVLFNNNHRGGYGRGFF